MRMSLSVERKTTTGFVMALILVVVIGVVAYSNGQQFVTTNQLVTHTVEVLGELEATLARVTDAETNQRGFVITGYPSYVDAYEVAQLRMGESLARLVELTADNPDQQVSLGFLQVLISEKFAITDNAIQLRRTGGFREAQQLALTGRGTQIMDNIRAIIQAMKDTEHALLDSRRSQSEATATNALLTFAAFTLVAAALLTAVYILINRDITGRKEAEEAVRRYADEIQDLYDNAPCGYHSLDGDNIIVQMNQTELDWLGYTREEVVGKLKCTDVIADESLLVLHENMPVLKERGWVHDLEFTMKRKDGSTFTALVNSTAIKDKAGNFFRTRSTVMDITDRKRIEEALRVSEERWRSLVQSAPDMIATFDLKGCLQFMNRLPDNVEMQDVIGKSMWDVVLPHQREGLVKAVEQVRQTGEAVSHEITNTLSRRHYTSHIGPIRVAGEIVGFITTSTDITDRKRIEDQIKRLNRDLERRTLELETSNKELEAFSYSVSHDLRAPLRAMNGFSKQLHEKYGADLPERALHYLSRIQQNSERMGRLIDDLLMLSRLGRQTLSLRSVNPNEVVREVLRDLNAGEEYAQTRITLDDLPTCQADATLLKQLYLNLLTNALKFSSRKESPHVHIGFQREPDECVYFVKDNGIGFDMQYAGKLFGVFERLHSSNEFGGTGVGLATVHRVVQRHGGRIWANAAPDEGAAFYFTLQGEPENVG